jgi:hypothetical protein
MSEDKLTYTQCVIKNTKEIYKTYINIIGKLGIIVGIIFGSLYIIVAISSVIVEIFENIIKYISIIIKYIIDLLFNVPWWGYIIFIIIFGPFMYVIVYCLYIRYKDEINKWIEKRQDYIKQRDEKREKNRIDNLKKKGWDITTSYNNGDTITYMHRTTDVNNNEFISNNILPYIPDIPDISNIPDIPDIPAIPEIHSNILRSSYLYLRSDYLYLRSDYLYLRQDYITLYTHNKREELINKREELINKRLEMINKREEMKNKLKEFGIEVDKK